MDVRELIASPPSLHHVQGEGYIHYGIDAPAVEFMVDKVKPGMVTLETGGGFTTLLMALLGAKHTCIMPAPELIDRIEKFAAEKMIDMSQVRFIAQGSEQVLPTLQTEPIDLALIDGRHGFPTPAIDWYYITPLMKVGGWVLIDDVHLWPCRILSDFLRAEPGWRQVENSSRGIDIFEMVSPYEHREWCDQPFVVEQSRGLRFRKKILQHWDLIRSGDFSGIKKRLGLK